MRPFAMTRSKAGGDGDCDRAAAATSITQPTAAEARTLFIACTSMGEG
jgi:hypothetical protein